MGVFTRPDSKFYQLWLETAPPGEQREKTDILIGRTVTQRKESWRVADDLYHKRMNAIARRIYRMPLDVEALRFEKYADTYETGVIPQHKGSERELERLKILRAFFGRDLLTKIDQDHVREYFRARQATKIPGTERFVGNGTINREVDLLKSMIRDAVPKYLESSPLVNMKRLKHQPKKKRLLHPDEETRLLTAATEPQIHALLVLGLDTLVRMKDLLNLQRANRDGVWLAITDPKNDEPYQVPMTPRAVLALDAVTHDQPYYFTRFRQAVKVRDWRGSVQKALKRLCAAAVPPVPYGVARGVTFHGATRKTGSTRMLIKEGRDIKTVQAMGGWTGPEMLLRIYAEAQNEDLLKAVGQATPAPKIKKSLTTHSRKTRKRA